jgi:hypothetical protein
MKLLPLKPPRPYSPRCGSSASERGRERRRERLRRLGAVCGASGVRRCCCGGIRAPLRRLRP